MKVIFSRKWDGKQRRCLLVKCKRCRNKCLRPKHTIKKNTFCSRDCFSKWQRVRVKRKCSQCGKKLIRVPSEDKRSRHGLYFCNRQCKEKAQSLEGKIKIIRPHHYGNGVRSYRERALKKVKLCQRCGYKKDVRMLDVHHANGKRSDPRLVNLEVLCVWCHALHTRRVTPHCWKGVMRG